MLIGNVNVNDNVNQIFFNFKIGPQNYYEVHEGAVESQQCRLYLHWGHG